MVAGMRVIINVGMGRVNMWYVPMITGTAMRPNPAEQRQSKDRQNAHESGR